MTTATPKESKKDFGIGCRVIPAIFDQEKRDG